MIEDQKTMVKLYEVIIYAQNQQKKKLAYCIQSNSLNQTGMVFFFFFGLIEITNCRLIWSSFSFAKRYIKNFNEILLSLIALLPREKPLCLTRTD